MAKVSNYKDPAYFDRTSPVDIETENLAKKIEASAYQTNRIQFKVRFGKSNRSGLGHSGTNRNVTQQRQRA